MDTSAALAKLKAALPRSWFGEKSPLIDGLMNSFAASCAMVYGMISMAALQTRINTATEAFLDMISGDYFGSSLPRRPNETDPQYRARIIANMFRERATRRGISLVVRDITGTYPRIFEPKRTADTGGYGAGAGFGVAGGYGSLNLPFQCFVEVQRPPSSGLPFVAGYGGSPSGYNAPSRGQYSSLEMVQGFATDAAIYEAIDSVKPVGTTVWVRIKN